MRVLAIETSCDETAITILNIKGRKNASTVSVLGNALHSQVKLHQQYGGVFPMMAKREHARVLTSLLKEVLGEAKELRYSQLTTHNLQKEKKIQKILEREGELSDQLIKLISKIKKPKIDCIAVTNGPGLEPALWVGINFAKVLSLAWDIFVIPINHMEGHLLVALLQAHDTNIRMGTNDTNKNPSKEIYKLQKPRFPLLALLISGGHTELVLMKNWNKYKVIGETRDDAVGEAFDKVARMLGLPYPGGPSISALAEIARTNADLTQTNADKIKLPRPMLQSKDLNFSFAGLKTAVLYALKKNPKITNQTKKEFAKEFEDAAAEVLVTKTKKALLKTGARTLVIGGGVSANKYIRASFVELLKREFPKVKFLIPEQSLTTDNAVMIGLAAFLKNSKKTRRGSAIRADGNLRLG